MSARYPITALKNAGRRYTLNQNTTRLAVLGNDSGQADTERIGEHWARFPAGADANGKARFGPAFRVRANPNVGYIPREGFGVQLKKINNRWTIIDVALDYLEQTGVDSRSLLANDPARAYRYIDELTDTSSRPYQMTGLKVQVQGWKYHTPDYQFKIDIGTNAATHVDLTDSVPAVEDTHRYAVVVFNVTENLADNDPWQVYDGTPIDLYTPLGEADIQTAYDLFPKDEFIIPIMAYYLAYGQTRILGPKWNVDLRTAWNLYGVIDKGVTLPKLANDVLHIAVVDPTVTDDSGDGYTVGSRWLNTVDQKEYVLTDASVGAAVWVETTGSGGGTIYYQTVQDNGADVTQRSKLNLIEGTNVTLAFADDAINNVTDVTISSTGGSGTTGYILIQDQKTQNTAGGTFGGLTTRALNTIVTDTTGAVSLSSNQFTLPAGTYRIRASAPAFLVERHQAWLYNVTDAAIVMRGTSCYNANGAGAAVTCSVITGRFTIASSKAFEIRHQNSLLKTTDGLGVAANFGTEIYTSVELEKE